MPDTTSGREKIVAYLNENEITINALAVTYGIPKQDMRKYLNGESESPKAVRTIIRIIDDLKIK